MLEVKGLNFSYGKNEVLKRASFTLDKGIKVMVAPNGAGKTTLFECISEQLSGEGSIEVDGKDLNDRKILEHLTFLGDYTILDPEISAYDYMKYISKLYNISEKRIEELAELTNFSSFYKNKIGSYSLGMKNRSMIALSILPDTEYIFLDEPLSGLDPGSVQEMKDLLLDLSKEKGII